MPVDLAWRLGGVCEVKGLEVAAVFAWLSRVGAAGVTSRGSEKAWRCCLEEAQCDRGSSGIGVFPSMFCLGWP